jgi:SNF2 family DNA or RNA helicase
MAIVNLYSAPISKCIERMNATLKGRLEGHYQHEGVRWMISRELQCENAKGGILADDMGLGKTMQTIALICANPLVPTLIVTTVGTVAQWRDALNTFGGLRPIIVNSSFSGILPSDCDVVVTAYSSFQKGKGELPQCFRQVSWGRVILDEGHTIRNQKTKAYIALNALCSKSKWVLSGTPIQNSLKDIIALIEWIGVSDTKNITALYDIYVLRRTQDGEGLKNPRLKLPPLETHLVKLAFKYEDEAAFYEEIEEYFESKLASASSQNKYSIAIQAITRCRQACTHALLYMEGMKKKLDNSELNVNPSKNGLVSRKRKRESDEDPLLCLSPPRSSKMDYLCDNIDHFLRTTKNKCLIFANWTLEMKIIQKQLKSRNISALIYDGSLSRDDKENVLYNFKISTIPVLILQIACGSTGLNLQCASRVYITSPHWNPCVELQAIGRAYRKGQTQKVQCIRLCVSNSIEERCLEVQQKKLDIIKKSMQDDSLVNRLGGSFDVSFTNDDVSTILKKK